MAFTFKDSMLNQKGKWLLTYEETKDKMVLDLDNMLFDNYEWYKLGEMQNEITLEQVDNIIKEAKIIKKI